MKRNITLQLPDLPKNIFMMISEMVYIIQDYCDDMLYCSVQPLEGSGDHKRVQQNIKISFYNIDLSFFGNVYLKYNIGNSDKIEYRFRNMSLEFTEDIISTIIKEIFNQSNCKEIFYEDSEEKDATTD